MRTIRLLLVVSLVFGCAGRPVSPEASKSVRSLSSRSNLEAASVRATAEEEKEIRDELNEALNYCQKRLAGYEERSAQQARWAFVLAMTGLVAGTVVAPVLLTASTANAVWAAGFSGWGGATNFAGQALKTSGLSGTTIAETRNEIVQNVKAQISIAINGDEEPQKRRAAVIRARAECILYEIAVPGIEPISLGQQ